MYNWNFILNKIEDLGRIEFSEPTLNKNTKQKCEVAERESNIDMPIVYLNFETISTNCNDLHFIQMINEMNGLANRSYCI